MALKKPSADQIKLLYKISVQLVAKIKEHSGDLKDKSLPVYIGIVAALTILAMAIGWYVFTKDIAPLMLYMAMLIPVLCFGLGEQSRNLNNLRVEFDEYNKSMDDFLTLISTLDEDKLSDEEKALGVILAAMISADEKVVDSITYGDIKQMPQYKNALAFAVNLAAIETSIDTMVDEEQDVSEILNSIDTSVIDTGTYFDDKSLYDIIMPDDEKSGTASTTTQDQENASSN